MSSRLFKQFIKKAILERQPGPPPREGLRWKPSTHRWIRPKEQDEEQEPYTGKRGSPDIEGEASFKTYGDPFFDGQFMDAIREGGKSGIDVTVGGDYNYGPLKEALREVNADEGAIDKFVWSPEVRTAIAETISDMKPRTRPGAELGIDEDHIEDFEAFNISDMPEIAFENIKDDMEMGGLPGPEHFKNAKEFASYLSDSTFQSMVDIRNDDPDPNYFFGALGFPDTEENVDAYINALDSQAKEYSEVPDFAKEYGTGVHYSEMEDDDDEDYDDDD